MKKSLNHVTYGVSQGYLDSHSVRKQIQPRSIKAVSLKPISEARPSI
jgi:hypothetical protein